MSKTSASRSRAFSPVIAAVILSAVVMAVGGAIWAFSQGAMTITSEEYAETVIALIDTISERFIIEHAHHDGVNISIFVFNYGEVDIEVKVNVKDVTYPSDQDSWIEIPSKEMVPFPSIPLDVSPGETLDIKAYTRRENNAFYRYLVPEV